MNEETKPACSCQARIKEAINSTPSSGHDYVDEVLGLLRVARSQRDYAEKMLLTRAGDRQSEAAPNAGDIASSLERVVSRTDIELLNELQSLPYALELVYKRGTPKHDSVPSLREQINHFLEQEKSAAANS